MLVGRKLQQCYWGKEKFILTTKLLTGLDGRKMSKTYNNTVDLSDSPKDMYGKLMRLHDDLILEYYELCTEKPMEEIRELGKNLKEGKIKPFTAKANLAEEITALYHGRRAAQSAQEEFNRVFREKKMPSQMPECRIRERKSLQMLELLVVTKLAPSKSEAKRLVLQGGVRIDNVLKKDWKETIAIKKGMVLQAGRRRFIKLI